jgi:hypothetical protein
MMANRNLEMLAAIARRLSPLLDELVFVGGCATGLLVTDPAAAEVRPTYDVDAIAEITSYAEYMEFAERLRKLGFREDDSEGAPICRWVHEGIKLDVMPMQGAALGFSNQWYEAATANALQIQLDGLTLHVVTAAYFLATKLDAFKDRGKNDYYASHDLEDVIAVMDGRPGLMDELRNASPDVQQYIAEVVGELLAHEEFCACLPGYLLPDAANQARLPRLFETLQKISDLARGPRA